MLQTQLYSGATITVFIFFSFKEVESRKARKHVFVEGYINLHIYHFLFLHFLLRFLLTSLWILVTIVIFLLQYNLVPAYLLCAIFSKYITFLYVIGPTIQV